MSFLQKYCLYIENIANEITKYVLPVLVQCWQNINTPMLGQYIMQILTIFSKM